MRFKITKYIRVETYPNLLKIDYENFKRFLRNEYKIIWSIDKKYFYISEIAIPHGFWLSAEKESDGKYDIRPFAFWNIRAGEGVSISRSHKLVKLYKDAVASGV